MFDETSRLKEERNLLLLLEHYAQANAADREAWLDRRMELAGAEPEELSRLHGELLAYGWVEPNTGAFATPRPGVCTQCYRTTAAGRRALQRALAERDEDLEVAA